VTARVHRETTYDASLVEVAAMLHDPAFREQVLAAQHVVHGAVQVTGDEVRVEQGYGADRVPSVARKLVGDEILIVREETWTSPSHADLRFSIPGKPGEIKGTARLAESGGRTVETVDLTVKVSVPLVGGKLEGLIADLLGKALDKEHETGHGWLAAGG
jgi:hypothetical protein